MVISGNFGIDLNNFISIRLNVITPIRTPTRNTWTLISTGPNGVQTGWGLSTESFEIVQMPLSFVSYSRILNINSNLIFNFLNSVLISKNSTIRVFHPPEFSINCDSFSRISLPVFPGDICFTNSTIYSNSTINSNLINLNFFDLILSEELVPGQFSFSVGVRTPKDVPASTQFSISIIESSGKVVDSAIGLFGPSFVPLNDPTSVSVQMASGKTGLKWYPSRVIGGSRMGVEFTIEFLNQVGIQLDGLIPVKYILIEFPKSVANSIDEVTEVEIRDLNFIGINFNSENYLKIELNQKEKILKGKYSILFPVDIPTQLPPDNVWYLSLCAGTGECSRRVDDGVIATLPVPGFNIGQIHPSTVVVQKSGHGAISTWFNLIVLVAVVLS